MIFSKLYNNPLTGISGCRKALLDSAGPYEALRSPGGAGIETGLPGATFSPKAVSLEGFARLMWGAVPHVAGGAEYPFWDRILEGLANGVNHGHEEYWGSPGDYDQLLVEMAVFGFALCLIPEKIWDPLSPEVKTNLAGWLGSINRRKIPDCNWVFFRILVNCALKKVGAKEFDRRSLESSLDLTEQFYIGNGWYNDGYPEERRARDYYIPWAFHYYGLIFSRCCGDDYPEYASLYRERAAEFAGDFLNWFASDGSSLPYGRSLTYRYAAAAFWGALAFADTEALPWGEIKGLFLRNLRWWFRQPFFTETGLQTVGYRYPNLYMAERYNSPNSPLWALKAFIPLALSEDHPFWLAEEKELPEPPERYVQEHTGFIFADESESGHLYALNAGQWTPGESNEHNHLAEKYSKFAYSSYFGFNVSVDTFGPDKLAADNMLLVSRGDRFYRYRMETRDHRTGADYASSVWSPFKGAEIKTYLALSGVWSIRLHHIVTDSEISTVEGGFPLSYGNEFFPLPEELKQETADEAFRKTGSGFSGIRNLLGSRTGKIIVSAPNSNIMYDHTLIPSLSADFPEGEFWTGCAVLAHPDGGRGEELWRAPADFLQITEYLKSLN